MADKTTEIKIEWLPGKTIKDYTLIENLATTTGEEGGFSDIWKGERRQGNFHQTVVIKRAKSSSSRNSRIYLDSLENEIRTWCDVLPHPYILPLLDVLRPNADTLLLISPFATGGTLAAELRKLGAPLSPERAIALMEGILYGLGYLHNKGILHLDLKPSNIALLHDIPLLFDFGISRQLTDTQTHRDASTIMGSAKYMAPEHLLGEQSKQADIWSAGIVLYEMLMGKTPFQAPPTAMYSVVKDTPHPPLSAHISAALRNIVDKALAKDRKNRYADGNEMREDLLKARDWEQRQEVRRLRDHVAIVDESNARLRKETDDWRLKVEGLASDLVIAKSEAQNHAAEAKRAKALEKERDTARKERDVAVMAEKAAKQTVSTLQASVSTLQVSASTLQAERDAARNDVVTLQGQVQNLKNRPTPRRRLTPFPWGAMAGFSFLTLCLGLGGGYFLSPPRVLTAIPENISNQDLAKIHASRGDKFYDENNFIDAEAEYKDAIHLQPNDDIYHNILGNILIDRGNKEREAEAHYREAIKLEPNNATYHSNLSNTLISLKHYIDAEKEARKSIHLDPNRILGHKALSVALSWQRNDIEAEKSYRKVVELDPNNAIAHYDLAGALYKLNRRDEAKMEAQKALKLGAKPGDSWIFERLGLGK